MRSRIPPTKRQASHGAGAARCVHSDLQVRDVHSWIGIGHRERRARHGDRATLTDDVNATTYNVCEGIVRTLPYGDMGTIAFAVAVYLSAQSAPARIQIDLALGSSTSQMSPRVIQVMVQETTRIWAAYGVDIRAD